jgi:hypothetical protein
VWQNFHSVYFRKRGSRGHQNRQKDLTNRIPRIGGFMFHLEPSHKKVYPGWKLPGVHEADSYVIEKVWKRIDRMIQEVPHAERKDFVPVLMATPSFSRLTECVLKEFTEKQIDL